MLNNKVHREAVKYMHSRNVKGAVKCMHSRIVKEAVKYMHSRYLITQSEMHQN